MDFIKPEAAGFNSERLKTIDTAMMRFIDAGKVGGIVTRVLRHGKVVQEAGYGLASQTPHRPMQADTLFRIWSMTKVITSVAVMMLYEQGHFVLDTDIVEFLPEFRDTPVYVSGEGDTMVTEPRKSGLSIRHFMTHSNGLAGGINAAHPVGKILVPKTNELVNQGANLETMVKMFAEIPLLFQPNTSWNYSNGLEVMARLVEVISGQRFQDYIREKIFEPLGMIDTGHFVRDDNYERFGAFYQQDGDKVIQFEAPDESHEYKNRHLASQDNWWARGGAGLISTAPDYAKFAQMLLNGGEYEGVRLLAPRTVSLMTTNHLKPEILPYNFPDSPPRLGYGHGLGVHTMMDHGLAGLPCTNSEYWKDGGAGTLFWVDPDLDLIGIVLYQLVDFWRVPVFDTFRAVVYQALDC